MKPRITSRGDDRTFSVMGVEITVLVSGEESDNAYTLFAQTVPPGKGSPLHTVQQDKAITVLEGEVWVTQGEEARPLSPGGCAQIPAGLPHNFSNRSEREARILVITSPGGHEDLLRGMARLGASGRPDPDLLAAHLAAHGARILTPSPTGSVA